MDSEKEYDMIGQHGIWQMLRKYRVGGTLLTAVQNFYVVSRACVCIGIHVGGFRLM